MRELTVVIAADDGFPPGLIEALPLPSTRRFDIRGDWDQFVLAVEFQQPDLVIIERSFWRRVSGQRLNRIPVVHERELRVLVYCDVLEATVVSEAVGNGVRGCLPRDASSEQWTHAIDAVLRGDIAMPRGWLAIALQRALRPRRDAPPRQDDEALTERENDVLRCVTDGLSNKEIARHLGISEATVKTHLHHVFEKLKVGRRALLMVGTGIAVQ